MNLRRLASCLAVTLALAAAAGALAAPAVPPEAFSGLRWRLAGPLRGGWATSAVGVPGKPETFYIGTPDGSVWVTADAGRTWNPLFDHEGAAAVGALALAPSDPAVLYVGTGQVTTRWDVTSGNGVYRSADGGRTWEHRGLADSRHIGRLWVDPRNADVVLAAAQGHQFGPNAERGVYRSTDGGRTWSRVLFVDENTGATDLAADPAAPDTVFASTWQFRGYPWLSYFIPNTGPGSGIFKSTDGGKTWTRLTGHGLPAGSLGRIGLTVAPGSQGRRVYATIDAGRADNASGLYRSDDGGGTWQQVNADGGLAGAYFASVTVDPKNADTIYVMGQSIRRSTDGGKTFTFFRGAPGGDDYHFLWIDPDHPERMITASDQGAVVTVNGGASWSSWYNQPTGQFYHVATDDRFPYWIYSGQQDSGTVAVASRSDYGQLTFRDWHPVGGDERDYDLPFPGNPDIVYGSGLGGRLSRWDARTGQVQNVAPWPVSSYGQRPTSVRYRTSWITPIAISPLAPHAIYQGAQVLFRSNDGGQSWAVVSPDLTGAASPLPADCAGDVPVAHARACGFGAISTIAPSPVEKDLVWVGTDSGLIHLTHDDGKTWQDVTPHGLPDWSRVAQIDASPTSAGTAYAAVDRHRTDDFHPYVYVTHDFGKTWRAATAGLPDDDFVGVVRQDPVTPTLLYAGTRRGAFVSFDDGGSWQPLQLNLPTTGVNDLTIHGNDLVAATEGRSLWVLDDVSPLRHLGTAPADLTLFPPAPAYRIAFNQNRDTPLPLDEPRTLNPPAGAVIDYWLPATVKGPVTLEIVDGQGRPVRRFRSDETPERPEGRQYFANDWLQSPSALPARPGHNRFVWDLRTLRPRVEEYEYSIAAVPGADTPELPQGLFVLPGTYEVQLKAEGRTQTAPLVVVVDPRSGASPADLTAQRDFYDAVSQTLEKITDAQQRVEAVTKRLKTLDGDLASRPKTGATGAITALQQSVKRLLTDAGRFGTGSSDDNLATIARALTPLATDLESGDRVPTGPQHEVYETYKKRLDKALADWQALENGPMLDLRNQLRAAGLQPVV
ncbi:MAG TPA: hypothetical protein VIA62_07770 [Thermoanaerobaculia bacterium]|jgi:photosystem II stability/assembly factor-like uncharacterized protein|nr:hypothetical protein [Thermoanaerobaculia bacterium]